MIWRPQPIPLVPEATATAVQATFPKGNLYVDMQTEFGTLYDDQLFVDLYADRGRPVETNLPFPQSGTRKGLPIGRFGRMMKGWRC